MAHRIITFLALSLAFVAMFLTTGCATNGNGAPENQLPWNTPAPWESGMIGVPY
ncbi:MAG: hypothetical protein K9N51_13575 [Candidatus Pacebacteria bacterium]|nr:hypothetical protein [Candidatus Paceibacterota bacterium]